MMILPNSSLHPSVISGKGFMDNQISQMPLADRQVAYLITNTQLEVINVGGDYALLHNLTKSPNMTKKKRKGPASPNHTAYLGRPMLELVPELDAQLVRLQAMLAGATADTQVLRICRTYARPPGESCFDIIFSPKHDS
ncbi:MAG: hypothetical protein KDE50_33700, partial [Caldilineaceae bacterium]|nr:hypothetical protein [Caldilineaceae bacterium]